MLHRDVLDTAKIACLTLAVALAPALADTALADGGVTFTDVAATTGVDFVHTPSADHPTQVAIQNASLTTPLDPMALPTLPAMAYGQPGVAIFDYDGDRDLDLYVSNGIGAPNSLYSNQLMETGSMGFVDVAAAAGVDATDVDGMGVCYGDTDNDGDPDLLVLGRDSANRFYENQGDGTFVARPASGLAGGDRSAPSCAMGDVDNDGLLDVVIANSWNHGNLLGCMVEPFALNQHNQLFLNQGGNTFVDVSATSGVEDLAGFPAFGAGGAGITWATSMVDVDQDGDVDVVFADDQCAMPLASQGGLDRGFLHVLLNDGQGQFSDQPIIASEHASGSWMGLGFGDLDCDGHLDIFGSNFGDYGIPSMGMPYLLGQQASRALYGNGDGTFSDPGVGNLGASVFGWGNAVFDYDNDGDLDALYHGGLEFLVSLVDNPGTLLQNQGCSGTFALDRAALTTDHLRRTVRAVAVGDLDRDGFADVVTGASYVVPESIPVFPSPAQYGSLHDADSYWVPIFAPTPAGMVWTGVDFAPGDVTVELASGNGNGWVAVTLIGSAGLTAEGRVNRSGIGAVASFTPNGGQTAIVPVQGGSSFGSQHSLETTFGLGSASQGDLEVLWPGGVRNRLYEVPAGARLDVPEIPCGYDADWPSFASYQACVETALADLQQAGVIAPPLAGKLRASAFRAFHDVR